MSRDDRVADELLALNNRIKRLSEYLDRDLKETERIAAQRELALCLKTARRLEQ